MRYILRPIQELSGCFLLDALYWVAFHKYPETDFDLNMENLQEVLDTDDIYDPVHSDYFFTFFNNELCDRYGFPRNPASVDENPTYETYLPDEQYEKIYGKETEQSLEIQQERKTSREYYRKLNLFEKALEKYLDQFQAKLYLALREGKIKARGMTLNREYTYSNLTKDFFETECQTNAQFEKKHKNIKDGDTFWAQDTTWEKRNPVDISADSWIQKAIDWEACQLDCEEQTYVYIQLDMTDLFREFPAPDNTSRTIKSFGDVFVMEDNNITITESRGRKPKINYDELYLWYCSNFDDFKDMKQEAVLAAAQQKFPQISRTTILNKLCPLLKEYRQNFKLKSQK